MARFLFTVWSFPGCMNPHIAVALALRARGHDVAIYTGERASAALTSLALTHFPMRHADEELLYRDLKENQSTGRAYSAPEMLRLRATLRTWLIDPIPGQMADLEPILASWRPDVIVCEPLVWAPFLLLAETRHIPVAILSWAVECMLSGPDALLWGLVLPFPRGCIGRWRNRLIRAGAGMVNRGFRAAVSALRARYDLPPLTMPVMDFAGTMPLYLVCSAPELDYNRRGLPAHVHYVGPCTWTTTAAETPRWLEELPAEAALVYVTEGTIEAGAPRLLQAAARGLAGLPIHVLLKNAQVLDPARGPAATGLGALAPNMRLEGFVLGQGWQSSVIARASIVITNGGPGSVLAALSAGVPLIVVPTTWEKPETAQRVVAAGAGIKIAPHRCTPEHLRAAVRHILATPSYRDNARRIGACLRRQGGAQRAAELLDVFARTRAGLSSWGTVPHKSEVRAQ